MAMPLTLIDTVFNGDQVKVGSDRSYGIGFPVHGARIYSISFTADNIQPGTTYRLILNGVEITATNGDSFSDSKQTITHVLTPDQSKVGNSIDLKLGVGAEFTLVRFVIKILAPTCNRIC